MATCMRTPCSDPRQAPCSLAQHTVLLQEPQHEAEPREHPDQQQQSLVPGPPISQPAQPPLVPCSAGSASGSLPRSLSLRAASYPSELSPLAFACGDDARPPPAVTPGSCASEGEQVRPGPVELSDEQAGGAAHTSSWPIARA